MADSLPIQYSPELAARVCELIASGISQRAIEDMPGMPSRVTLYKWGRRDSAFKQAMDEARLDAADLHADSALYIADTVMDPQRARNMIEVRKWLASVIKPRIYGTKIDLSVTANMHDPAELAKEARRRMQVMHNGTPALPAIYEVQPADVAEAVEVDIFK